VPEAAALAKVAPSAMIDVSDGLAVDLDHLLDAGGVGCEVDEASVPVDPDLTALDDVDPLEAAMLGGEDFELLFTVAPSRVGEARAALQVTETPVTRIGTVVEGRSVVGSKTIEEWRRSGWEHLRGR
jgi:thiamine-monophosphate kinase